MRRRFLTTEFWTTCVLLLVYAFCVDAWHRAIAGAVIGNAYVIGRLLFKRNRGLHDAAVLCTEFYIYLVSQMFVIPVFTQLWYVPLINHAVYLLVRGRTKGIGVVTQFIR